MATSSFNKVNNWCLLLGTGVVNLASAGATILALCSNTTPNATWTTVSQITELSTSGGYTAGGQDIQNDYTASGGTGTMTAVDVTWTGSAGGFTARYIWLALGATASDKVLGWYDYGASQAVGAGETWVLDFGASVLTIT
jgi:hypothetical protein